MNNEREKNRLQAIKRIETKLGGFSNAKLCAFVDEARRLAATGDKYDRMVLEIAERQLASHGVTGYIAF